MIEVPGRKTLPAGQLVRFTFESDVNWSRTVLCSAPYDCCHQSEAHSPSATCLQPSSPGLDASARLQNCHVGPPTSQCATRPESIVRMTISALCGWVQFTGAVTQRARFERGVTLSGRWNHQGLPRWLATGGSLSLRREWSPEALRRRSVVRSALVMSRVRRRIGGCR
jgi:hypothetical protein